MSVSEKTFSVPSRPMGVAPGSHERDEPDNQRQRAEDDGPEVKPCRRKLPGIVEAASAQCDREEKGEKEQRESACERSLRENPVSARNEQRNDPAQPVPGTHPPAHLFRLPHVSLDPHVLFSDVQAHAGGSVERLIP